MSGLEIAESYWEPPDHPEAEAYMARCEANRRYQCEDCWAFVSKAAGDRQMMSRSYYDDRGVSCEPGKGCNRKAAPDA